MADPCAACLRTLVPRVDRAGRRPGHRSVGTAEGPTGTPERLSPWATSVPRGPFSLRSTTGRLEGDRDVTAFRLGGAVRDHQHAAVPAAARTPWSSSSASWRSSPLVGSSRITTGRASRARATARRRRSPPESATPSSRRGCRARPQRGHHASRRAPGAHGPPPPRRRRAGPGGGWSAPCREHLGTLVGQRAGGARVVRASSSTSPRQREGAALERPEAQQRSDQAGLACTTRPGDGDPAPGGRLRLTPSTARGRPGP